LALKTRPTLALTFVLGFVVYAAPAAAQAREACLHSGALEAPAEARRRDDALAAARMINTLAASRLSNRSTGYLTWEQIADSPQLASLRGAGGPAGELARKIQWGTDEPLPGWAIHYIASDNGYAFSLTDTRDPCLFTYSSNDRGVVVEGQPVTRRGPGIVPLS
jgi:hypothetical protein